MSESVAAKETPLTTKIFSKCKIVSVVKRTALCFLKACKYDQKQYIIKQICQPFKEDQSTNQKFWNLPLTSKLKHLKKSFQYCCNKKAKFLLVCIT